MALHYVVSGEDRAAFLDCRRAWDFSARERGNLAPVQPAGPTDIERAIRDALAVYYFPGMWDWQPAIVLPLVRKAFADSVAARRAEYLAARRIAALPDELAAVAVEREQLGLGTVEAYVGWAPTVDEFAPIQVVPEIDVQVGDLAEGGRPVRYRDRADMLVMDEENGYWMVEHRLVDGSWPDLDAVLRDDRCLSWCWAWEQDNPGLHLRGTIYNEIRIGDPEIVAPPHGPRSTVAQNRTTGSLPVPPAGTVAEYDLRIQLGEGFRRVQVPRRPVEVAAFGERLTNQLTEMIDPTTRAYPNPSTPRCEPCPFRTPCLACDAGGDTEALLAGSYRIREHDARPGTLGARTWSMGRGAAPPGS